MEQYNDGDKIIVTGDKYKPFIGMEAVVTQSYPHDFRIQINGCDFQILIKDPAVDINPIPVDINEVTFHLAALRKALPDRGEIDLKQKKCLVKLPERDFRLAFGAKDFRYQALGMYSVLLVCEEGGVRFEASVDHQNLATAREALAAQETKEDEEEPDEA